MQGLTEPRNTLHMCTGHNLPVLCFATWHGSQFSKLSTLKGDLFRRSSTDPLGRTSVLSSSSWMRSFLSWAPVLESRRELPVVLASFNRARPKAITLSTSVDMQETYLLARHPDKQSWVDWQGSRRHRSLCSIPSADSTVQTIATTASFEFVIITPTWEDMRSRNAWQPGNPETLSSNGLFFQPCQGAIAAQGRPHPFLTWKGARGRDRGIADQGQRFVHSSVLGPGQMGDAPLMERHAQV